jgi:microcystin-dependent protein
MSLETASYIHQLNPANPSGADRLKDGDDHIRMLKAALKATFPGIQGALSASVTHTFLNSLAASLVPTGIICIWSGLEANLPAGWAICDGRTVPKSDGSGTVVTPDMSDKVPVGVSPSRIVRATFGQYSKTFTSGAAGAHSHTVTIASAGAHSHTGASGSTTLTVAQMPAHRHFVVADAQNSSSAAGPATGNAVVARTDNGNNSSAYLAGAPWMDANVGPTSPTGGSEGHTHTISADGAHIHTATLDAAPDHAHAVTIDTSQPSIAVYFIMKV